MADSVSWDRANTKPRRSEFFRPSSSDETPSRRTRCCPRDEHETARTRTSNTRRDAAPANPRPVPRQIAAQPGSMAPENASSVDRADSLGRHRGDIAARAFGPAGRIARACLEFTAGGAVAAKRTAPPERSVKLGALTQSRSHPSRRLGRATLHGLLIEHTNDVKAVAGDLQPRHSRIHRSFRQIDAELHQHPFGDGGGAEPREPEG